MCGRFTLSSPAEAVAELFELTEMPELAPRYNIAPAQDVPAVRIIGESAGRRLDMLRWGLIPFWADDPASFGSRTINARAETVSSKPTFRSAFRQRRCLIVADGFYEWQKRERRKQPYYIHLSDKRPFAFAGLWERWEGDADTGVVESCTIVTTDANELTAPLHARMPVILKPRDYAVWLDAGTPNVDVLQSLLRPYPLDQMSVYPIGTRVNSPSNDDPDCIRPLC